MTNINETIVRFLTCLKDSWSSIEEIDRHDSTGSFKCDLLQALWELAVEGQLRSQLSASGFLVPYGDGADSNGANSRIISPAGIPTHCVNCLPKECNSAFDYLNDTNVIFPANGLACDRFVTIDEDGWYSEQAPFDMVLVDGEAGEMVFKADDLDMVVIPVAG